MLDEAMQSYRLQETPTELEQRERVLSKLREVLQEYALHEGCLSGMSEEIAASKLVQVRTFGSYRLGVHAPEADIDTFVPVIKFKMLDIAVDLLFVSLSMESVPANLDVLNDQLLCDLDEPSVRSLNGVRVTERILQLVPNKDRFRTTLIIVKHWARVRGIYSNVLGFLGGVNWAILVARVCQLYPNALPATLLGKFFRVYHLWWSHFLRIQITARDASSLSNWLSWVESRLRYLLQRLEGVPNLRPHPLARFIDVENGEGDIETSWFFVALSFHAPSSGGTQKPGPSGLELDLTGAVQDFARQVEQWEHRRGGMDLEVTHVLRADLPDWVIECVDGVVAKETGKDKSRRDETCSTDDSTPHSRVSNSPVKRLKAVVV
ncbi:hypothetical protein ATCC90586_000949 [Pythium insidiosum]|nr:hypothetical protein ATCC90586_000949 [Pythium insidiosum]